MVSSDQMQGLTKLLGKDMPEIAYLKQAGISEILSKGLAETFRARPLDPKTYFAKYLLNHAQDRDTDQLVGDHSNQERGGSLIQISISVTLIDFVCDILTTRNNYV